MTISISYRIATYRSYVYTLIQILLVPLYSTITTSITAVLVDLEKYDWKVNYHVYRTLYLPIIVRV
jgi:hypothetical protein